MSLITFPPQRLFHGHVEVPPKSCEGREVAWWQWLKGQSRAKGGCEELKWAGIPWRGPVEETPFPEVYMVMWS